MTIKRSPDDFQVREILTDECRGAIRTARGRFGLYTLTKHSLTTPAAIGLLAKSLRIAPEKIAFAGLKDRHASTVQHVTIQASRADRATLPATISGKNWNAERVGWLDEKFSAARIAGNRFEIKIRGLTPDESQLMTTAANLLATQRDESSGNPSAIRIVNYFGDQRFGSARHGQGFLARFLIEGNFENALKLAIATPARQDRGPTGEFKKIAHHDWGDWKGILNRAPRCPESAVIGHLARSPGDYRGAFAVLPYFMQQISVEAYQSHLWNAMARQLVTEQCAEPGEIIEADDQFGTMIFPSPANISLELLDLELPLLGRRTALAVPWKSAAEQVLAMENISDVSDLHIPGLKRPFFGEAPRRLFVDATEFVLDASQKDEKDSRGERFRRRLIMQLPRGAYATVVLRALGQ